MRLMELDRGRRREKETSYCLRERDSVSFCMSSLFVSGLFVFAFSEWDTLNV